MKSIKQKVPPLTWQWPVDLNAYDRTPELSQAEHQAFAQRLKPDAPLQKRWWGVLGRLLQPIDDVLKLVGARKVARYETIRLMALEMCSRGTPFWNWSTEQWLESMVAAGDLTSLGREKRSKSNQHVRARPFLPVLAYLLCFPSPLSPLLDATKITLLARKIIGRECVDQAAFSIAETLQSWGYQLHSWKNLCACVSYLFLYNKSPYLEDLTFEVIREVEQQCTVDCVQEYLFQVSRALAARGVIEKPLPDRLAFKPSPRLTEGTISQEWLSWCDRWRQQSTTQRTAGIYYPVRCVGRWLQKYHPDITSPAQWTYELAIEWVKAVMELRVGDWADPDTLPILPASRRGQPLRPHARNAYLKAMRAFFHDCQEWGWISAQFNPLRAFRSPRSLRSLIGPDPRVIDKEFWAKLLWAALNLEAEDLPGIGHGPPAYPVEMVRAIAVVWCFSALRSDEIRRLRVGCIRWQHEDVMVPETGDILPKDAICFLDVPVNKTSTAYTKAVHPLVGQKINEWEQVRPKEQLYALDMKTSETVHFLFAYKGQLISIQYINHRLIPKLCRKAGLPEQDSRGQITSHRARATIASMLYNAKEPLSIFELKEFLGHKYLSSTQSYLRVDPTKLASKVAKSGYLEQNLATIEVLLDQEAVLSGAAARGEIWKYYDLGHGYCTNSFWAECKHRMACARCPFYRPKTSTLEQLVEGKANLVRMLEFIQLTEDESFLVVEGIDLHQALIEKLSDIPTPAGPTPRELEAERQGERKLIPIKAIQRPEKRGL
jgi:integrase